MSNLVLKKGESEILITSKPSVLQMDQIMILYRKYNAFVIGELELTLEAAKVLLIDKTKEIEIDSILKGDFKEETSTLVDDWGKIVFDIITKVEQAKKKLVK